MIWVTSSGIQTGGSCICQSVACHLRAPAVREDQTGVQLFDCSGYPCWGWSKLELSRKSICFFSCFTAVLQHIKCSGKFVSLQLTPPSLSVLDRCRDSCGDCVCVTFSLGSQLSLKLCFILIIWAKLSTMETPRYTLMHIVTHTLTHTNNLIIQ